MSGFILIDRFGHTSEGGHSDMGYHLDLVVGDNRYMRRDAPSSIAPNIIISFQDADNRIRIKNGRLMLRNRDTNLYHFVYLKTTGEVVNLHIDQNPET